MGLTMGLTMKACRRYAHSAFVCFILKPYMAVDKRTIFDIITGLSG